MQRQERKVTATVLAIVTCFTLTHVSLVLFRFTNRVSDDVITLLKKISSRKHKNRYYFD